MTRPRPADWSEFAKSLDHRSGDKLRAAWRHHQGDLATTLVQSDAHLFAAVR